MAKLTATQKRLYSDFKLMMDAQGEYAFFFDKENGVSALAIFTGDMKNHVRLIVAHCGENDTFKKKLGFIECVSKLESNEGIVLPAEFDSIEVCLTEFLMTNYDACDEWWSL